MAKFTYRMQNILDIKIKLENQAKIAYATASRQLAGRAGEASRDPDAQGRLREKIKRAGQRNAGYPGDPGMQACDRCDEESAESTDDEGARRGKDAGDGANRTEPGDGGAKDA